MENKDIEQCFDQLAPNWDSKEKSTKEELKSFLKVLGIKKGEKVLDLGCGTGIISNILFDFSLTKVVAMDASSKMIEIAQQKNKNNQIEFVHESFYDYQGETFDYIVIFNAYPHFVERDKFKLQLEKHLKSGGKFAVIHNLSSKQLSYHHRFMGPNVSR